MQCNKITETCSLSVTHTGSIPDQDRVIPKSIKKMVPVVPLFST